MDLLSYRTTAALAAGLLIVASLRAQQPTPEDMPQELVWVDRAGKILGRVGSVQNAMFYPELSPDDRFIAVSARDGDVNDRDVWIHDVATGTKRQITNTRGNDNLPVWSPDGKRIAFTSSRRDGNYDLYVKTLEPDAPETSVLATERREFPNHWSPDGRFLSYTRDAAKESPVRDIFLLPFEPGAAPRPFLQKPNVWHDAAEFSPDSRLVAYASNAGGPFELYVSPIDDAATAWKVSRELSLGWAGGGGQPRWRGDGRELFYIVGNDTMMSVEVDLEGGVSFKPPRRLFARTGLKGNFPDEMPWLQKYDVTADGQRFVFVRKVETATLP